MYILLEGKPYYYYDGRIFPCSISADSIIVDTKNHLKKKVEVKAVFTEDEIRHRLNIMMIDVWDPNEQRIIKKSNQTISSIPVKSGK